MKKYEKYERILFRQKFRIALLIISLLLFPITIWYMSPYLIIMGALEGVISGSAILFILLFFGSIFGGRIFCSYVCPMGGLAECLIPVNDKPLKKKKSRWIKPVLWSIWIVSIFMIFVSSGRAYKADPLYQTFHGISVANPYAYIIYYGVIVLVLLCSLLIGRRAFCHYFCWMSVFMILGVKMRRMLRLPGLRIVSHPKKCVSCLQCDRHCPMGLPVSELLIKGEIMEPECIQCGACVDNCPKAVLEYGMRPIGEKGAE